MSPEQKAMCCYLAGYDYGAIGTMAIQWDCSFEDAINKIFDTL